MREIKFRFWVDGVNGKFMTYPDNREGASFNSKGWEFYLDDEGFEIINHRGVVEPAYHVPMQYTGLKDKNGVEIYEGDVLTLKYPHDRRYTVTAKVIRGTQISAMMLKFEDEFTTEEIPLYKISAEHNLEVMGNIYENPELLEVAE